MDKNIFGSDAFSPVEVAEKVENIGVTKARLPFVQTFMLGVLAGAFISLGSLFFVLVTSDDTLPFALSRVLGGAVFSIGLLMVVIAGAELFTGNNLIVMAWADKRIRFYEVLRNWVIVCTANLIGALIIAIMLYFTNHHQMNDGAVGEAYVRIANYKCGLSFSQAFFSGIFCNIFVCLAVWMSQAGRSVIDKVVVVVFPVMAFVAAGFEHSIANMFLIPMGHLLKDQYPEIASANIDWSGFAGNLGPVILGNLTGGSVFVALIYYLIYGRVRKETPKDK